MKLVCNNYTHRENPLDESQSPSDLNITIGKIYDLVNSDNIGYCVVNDLGEAKWFMKWWFTPLNQVRDKRIEDILDM
jgi:hypothetical protein